MVYNNSGFINDIVKDYTENKEPEVKEAFEVKAEPVRYKGGETEKDDEGKEFTEPAVSIGPLKSAAQVPIKAKAGEPESVYEWAEDAAQMSYDTGDTIDEIEKKLAKKWKLADAQIKNNKNKTVEDKYQNDRSTIKYYGKEKVEDGYRYLTPKQVAEEVIGSRYKFRPIDEIFYNEDSGPSWAGRVLKKIGQQENWNRFTSGKNIPEVNYYPSNDSYTSDKRWVASHYNYLKNKIRNLLEAQKSDELKKLGVNSKDQLNRIALYLESNLNTIALKMYDNLDKEYKKGKYEVKAEPKQENKAKVTEPAKTENKATENKATENKAKVTEPAKTENTSMSALGNINAKQENAPEETATENNEPAKTENKAEETVKQENVSDEGSLKDQAQLSYDKEETKVNYELSEQERIAQEEAEESAKREMTEQEAADLDKKIDEAARKRLQDQFDYEDWLKNPTIISGIFGKSGLSIAKRIGLGLSTLFAIFSDVARNYGKGINNNTDFKNDAMAELYKTIGTIQDKRAQAAGDMAAGYFQSTTENDKQLNTAVTKMRRLPIASYVPDTAMRIFAQESIINPEAPLSESLYNQVIDESRNGFINNIKKNKTLKNAYLDADGNLNELGEVKFLEKEKNVLDAFKNVMSLSDARMANINRLLELERNKADTRKKVHDVNFQTNLDYINATNSINAEITSLETSKLKYTEAATLDTMLDLAIENRNLMSGLSTSNSASSNTETSNEAILKHFQEQKGLEEVNEELAKHGFKAEINANAGAKFPFDVIPISANIDGGLQWTSEQANKHLESKYNKFVNDQQRSASKARSLSNATGQNVDDFTRDVVNWLQTEKAKGAEADFNKVRQQVINSIDERIEKLRDIDNELNEMRKRETRFDTSTETSASTNPYVSMFNDVPSKNNDWYRHRLSLT